MPRTLLIRLSRSEAARYVGVNGESTIRAAEAKGLPHEKDGELTWHFAPILDQWPWRLKKRTPKRKQEAILRRASAARGRERGLAFTSKLAGRYFHARKDTSSEITWQGRVLGRTETRLEETWLVQLFSWIDGLPTCLKVVGTDDLFEWDFYESTEAMVAAYERYQHAKDKS